MAVGPRKVAVCSCEDTMPLDLKRLARACPDAALLSGRHLCRSELQRLKDFAQGDEPILIGCTQEAPIFLESVPEAEQQFVNLRETAGWSRDAAQAGPKMAALIAAAREVAPPVPLVPLSSDGVLLIYGRDEKAIEAAELLKDHLDITVLMTGNAALPPLRATGYPVVKGTIRAAKGHLGAFELTVDDYAAPSPSSRNALVFGPSRNNAASHCDLILDLSAGTPLFPAHDLRDGYLRADPRDAAAYFAAIMKARDLVGTFDKPRYITFTADLCAHSRSRIVGCRRCLDACPTGAIAPAGDHVAIDALICAGCGQCAALCPTGAASYALPPSDALLRRLRSMLTVYGQAGGRHPVLLVHDEDHGSALIEALARFGEGLPANVLPFSLNEVTQVGIEFIAAAFAYGAMEMRFLLRAKPRHDVSALRRNIALAEPILSGLGLGSGRVATIETDDPDNLSASLTAITTTVSIAEPASFAPVGGKREMQHLALRELHRVAPHPVDVIALPVGAPFGAIEVNVEGCTLCLSCVSACPAGALRDDPERPTLRFAEDACVQCGLCAATCPEKVISLKPQLDFRAINAPARVLKQEEPFHCIRCDKAFGVKSTIERVAAKLEGTHWMFQGSSQRLDLLKMCDDCRVVAVTEQDFDPYGAPARPRPRTSDDYFAERDKPVA